MATTRITDLKPYSGGSRSDVFPIVNITGNTTERITVQELYDRYSANTTTTYVVVMPKIISGNFKIPNDSNAFVFGEDIEITGDIEVGENSTLYVFNTTEYQLANNIFNDVSEYLDNTDAINNGLPVGKMYRTGDLLKIVHN
jgi:hypothetical protein